MSSRAEANVRGCFRFPADEEDEEEEEEDDEEEGGREAEGAFSVRGCPFERNERLIEMCCKEKCFVQKGQANWVINTRVAPNTLANLVSFGAEKSKRHSSNMSEKQSLLNFDIGSGIPRRVSRGRVQETAKQITTPGTDERRRCIIVSFLVLCLLLVASIILAIYFGIDGAADDDIMHNHTEHHATTMTLANTTAPAMPRQNPTSAGAVTEAPHQSTTQAATAVTSTTTGTSAGATTTTATTLPPATDAQEIVVALQTLCNVRFDNGTCRAIVTYQNDNAYEVSVAHGPNNYVSPGAPNLNQRTVFKQGLNYGGATFLWDCTEHDEVVWTVRSGGQGVAMTAIVPAAEQECPPVPTGEDVLDHTITGPATI